MSTEERAPALEPGDLAALRCPLSGQALRFADERSALVTEDGSISYPVVDGILCLTVEAAQRIDGTQGAGEALDPVTAGLQRFYDETGWQSGEGRFEDARLFEDLRPVSAQYIRRCHLRVREHLPAEGELLLDAGSGPVQFDEYLTYHDGFRKRLCVDISLNALRQARARLGDRGIYVQADLTRLPLAEKCVDAAVSLHTIYHIPAGLQERAFLELHRVLKPGGRGVVVYSWAQSRTWRLVEAPNAIKLRWQRLADRVRGGAGEDEESRRERSGFYFHPHSAAWFHSRPWPFESRLAVWRFPTVSAMKLYVHPWLGGRWLLAALIRAESRWPEQLGEHAAYPLILIDRAG